MYYVKFQKEHVNTINKNVKLISLILDNQWDQALSLLGLKNSNQFECLKEYYLYEELFLYKIQSLKNKTEFTYDELNLLSKLCDACCRFELGQVSELILFLNKTMPEKFRQHSLIGHPSITKIKKDLFDLDHNAYFGVYGHKSFDCKLNCEIHQKIRNYLSWEKYPKGGTTVNFDEPDSLTEIDLPEISKTNN